MTLTVTGWPGIVHPAGTGPSFSAAEEGELQHVGRDVDVPPLDMAAGANAGPAQ
jgi:hypothetical protein